MSHVKTSILLFSILLFSYFLPHFSINYTLCSISFFSSVGTLPEPLCFIFPAVALEDFDVFLNLFQSTLN